MSAANHNILISDGSASGRFVLLAAGGTGGHMFPAYALGAELQARGHIVALMTDARGARYADATVPTVEIPALRFGLATMLSALRTLFAGMGAARMQMRAHRPALVVGFGGYPALPVALAAFSLGVPVCLHEQNAVAGRVNRLIAPFARALAMSFPGTSGFWGRGRRHAVVTGNPVRADIAALADIAYPTPADDGVLRILVLGGSQGASILGDVVPAAISLLPKAAQARVQVTQQCRAEDIDKVRRIYADCGVAADCATFLTDIPERLRWAHLLIGRAGASTVCETAAAGRPAILVPLPSATDDHQTANARELAEAGGAWVIPQPQFTAAELAKRLQKLANAPDLLAAAAAAARKIGRPRAAADLADLVEQVAGAMVTPNAAKPRIEPGPPLFLRNRETGDAI